MSAFGVRDTFGGIRAMMDAALAGGVDEATALDALDTYQAHLRSIAPQPSPNGSRPADEDEPETYVSLADLLARPELLRPPEPVVPRVAYRARVVTIAAPPKGGKSTFEAHVAASLSVGSTFLGERIDRPGRVIWCGLEEALSDAVIRFRDLRADPSRIQLLVLAGPDLLARTDDLLASWPADLFVVDSLIEWARVTGRVPEEGDSAGWSSVIRPIVALARRRNMAVNLLDHTRRDGEERGSSEKSAAVDALLTMRMPESREDPTVRRIEGRGRWPIEPFSVALRDGQYVLDGGAALSLDALILLHVERAPGCSLRDVRGAVGGRTETVTSAVRRLADRGALEDRGAGDRMVLHPAGGGAS